MVEVRGVEPLSESTSSETSPGADDYLNFPMPGASRHARGFGSFIIHGALKALRTHGRRLSTPHTRAAALPGATLTAYAARSSTLSLFSNL